MKAAVIAWGLILLIGLCASEYLLGIGYSEMYLWVAWAIIFVVLNFAVGKTYKKMPKEVNNVWIIASAFGFLSTLAVASGLVVLSYSWLMALWLFLIGGAMFAGSFKSSNASGIFVGLVYILSGIVVPAAGYFAYGALVFGLLGIISGYFE